MCVGCRKEVVARVCLSDLPFQRCLFCQVRQAVIDAQTRNESVAQGVIETAARKLDAVLDGTSAVSFGQPCKAA